MLKGILSISGQPGLFKMVTEAKNSIIVESLLTGKRIPAYSTSKISALADISVFSATGEIQLKELFKQIQENGKTINPMASANEIKAFFEEILPEYDKERVYVSDMKKIFQWYQLLSDLNLLTEIEEVKRLGYDYQRKTMCTVRMGRKFLPGYKTYSLGKLCSELGISINGRHRAAGDALATVSLFEMILARKAQKEAKQPNTQLRLF